MSRIEHVGVIVNPIAGAAGRHGTTGSARVAVARRALDRLSVFGEVVQTSDAGQAARLTRELVAAGATRIVAWGGDGTLNEVAGPLIGSDIALGIVRSGSGDGLARSLGVSLHHEAAMDRALSGASRAIDVGYLGDRHFLNVAGIGFDAEVAAAFNRGGRRGQLGYLFRTLQAIWGYRARRYRVRFEHESSDATRFVIAFANGRQYGGGLMLAADADPADGWLEAVVLDDGSAVRQLWRIRRLAFGVRRPAEGVFRYRIRTASVTGDRLMGHVDGETFEATGTIDVRVRAGALRVVW